MSSQNSLLRVTLVSAIHELEDGLHELDQALRVEASYPIWAWHEKGPESARLKVRSTLRAIDYCDGQDPAAAVRCPALVGVSTDTLAIGKRVNEAKGAVFAALKAMDKISVEEQDPITGETVSHPLVKIALAALGHARLHRRQATRKMVILDDLPASVSFIWARLPKIETIDVAEARRRLESRLQEGGRHSMAVEADLRRLTLLSADEPLAEVKPPHIHPRVNIVWRLEDGLVRRGQKRAVLPIFYPAKPSGHLPRLRPLPEEPPPEGQRLSRSDVRVSPEAYLHTIRVHRYLSSAPKA